MMCSPDRASWYATNRNVMSSEMRQLKILVLTVLEVIPRCGYAVIQEVERASGSRTEYHSGTIDYALDRLTREGSIRIADKGITNSRLKHYEITPDGNIALFRAANIKVPRAMGVADVAQSKRNPRHERFSWNHHGAAVNPPGAGN